MKCPYCGGEVGSMEVKCPFCGRENKVGQDFENRVREKRRENEALPGIVLRLKEKEIAGRLLTRINLGLILFAIILLVFSFLLFFFNARREKRTPIAGSFAEKYLSEFYHIEDGSVDYDYERFVEVSAEMVTAIDQGKEITHYDVEKLVRYAYRVASDAYTEPENEARRNRALFVEAFFRGYLSFTDEEMSFMTFEGEEKPSFYLSSEKSGNVEALVEKRLEGRKK